MSEKKQCQCYTAVQIGTCDENCDRVSENKQTAVNESAKQKAVEIFESTYENMPESLSKEEAWSAAKQCALIAVDYLIQHDPTLPIEGEWDSYAEDIKLSGIFWQQVRSEIEKL